MTPLQEHCRNTGVSCELVYPQAPGVTHSTPTEYLIAKLKASRKVQPQQTSHRRTEIEGWTVLVSNQLLGATTVHSQVAACRGTPARVVGYRVPILTGLLPRQTTVSGTGSSENSCSSAM